MVQKKFLVVLLFYLSFCLASEYRSGFRNRKENEIDSDNREEQIDSNDSEVAASKRQEKRMFYYYKTNYLIRIN